MKLLPILHQTLLPSQFKQPASQFFWPGGLLWMVYTSLIFWPMIPGLLSLPEKSELFGFWSIVSVGGAGAFGYLLFGLTDLDAKIILKLLSYSRKEQPANDSGNKNTAN